MPQTLYIGVWGMLNVCSTIIVQLTDSVKCTQKREIICFGPEFIMYAKGMSVASQSETRRIIKNWGNSAIISQKSCIFDLWSKIGCISEIQRKTCFLLVFRSICTIFARRKRAKLLTLGRMSKLFCPRLIAILYVRLSHVRYRHQFQWNVWNQAFCWNARKVRLLNMR